jgi:hypothetical protein
MLDLFSELRDAINGVLDKRPQYGDGSDGDVVYATNTTIANVDLHARTITVQPGITLSIAVSVLSIVPVLFARERIINRGTIRAVPYGGRTGVTGGAGADYATSSGDLGGPGSGGDANGQPGGEDPPLHMPWFLDLDLGIFRPPKSEFEWLNWATTLLADFENPASTGRYGVGVGMYGSSGGSAGNALSGRGGEAGSALLLAAPIIDNSDGIIECLGGDGGPASSDTPDAWQALTGYDRGDPALGTGLPYGSVVIPTTPNSHAYLATVSGTSAGSEPTWPTGGGTVTDGTVHWVDLGSTHAAGGGGGGSGGVFGAMYRQWIGPRPVLTGGAGGAGYGGGSAGVAGRDGVRIELVDA